jgi:hypothetical protein
MGTMFRIDLNRYWEQNMNMSNAIRGMWIPGIPMKSTIFGERG